jgi:hypothetical protein
MMPPQMGTGILSVLAIVSGFLFFCFTRGQKMREDKRAWPELFWYAGGLLPLALVTLVWTSMENQAVAQRVLLILIGGAVGALLLYSLGEYLRPTVAQPASQPLQGGVPMAQGPTINTWNQSGGTNIINAGPSRLQFEGSVADQLASALPRDKPITIQSIGGDADQAVVNQYQEYLQSRGFRIAERNIIGIMSPPPDKKISIMNAGDKVVVTIAPSAN